MSELNTSVIELIRKEFGATVKDIEVKQDTSSDQVSGENILSARDRLLLIFSRRARGMDRNHEVYPKVVEFLSELRELNIDEPMYYWNCSVENVNWGGWATSKKVIFCLERK